MMEARTNGASARSGGFAARAASATAPRFARREGASGATSASSAPSASVAATGPAPADSLRFAKGPQDVRRAKRLALVAALSAAVAVIAVGYGTWAVVSASAQVGAVESDLAPTLVATTGIAAGDAVSPDQLEVVEVPRAFRAEGALDADAVEEVVGGRAAVDIPSGAQIVPGLVAGTAGGDHLAAALGAGMEAVLTTVCERALVVSVGAGQNELATSGGAVTIAVSPEEADAVREAQYAGRVSFALVALVDAMEEEEERG